MKTTLTISAVWKNKRTGEEYELLGHNIESDRVQIYPLKKNGDTAPIFMTANSLRKNYVAVAKRITEDNKVELKTVEKQPAAKVEKGSIKTKSACKIRRVELADGTVVSGDTFIIKVAEKTIAETSKTYGSTWWLSEIKAGKELLAQHNATIVYKPLTK